MKSIQLLALLFFVSVAAKAQYNVDVLSYHINGTPVNGIKIKTNLPFTNSSHIPTIIIEGFNYATSAPISLYLSYYYFNDGFIKANVSSAGGYTPNIYVAGENGKIVIFIDDRSYFQRFHIRAYAKGISGDNPANYTGWTVVDSTLLAGAQSKTQMVYLNRFSGTVNLPGNSIWNSDGSVGIGTLTPGTYKLAVSGTIAARKVKITQTGWADYVFNEDYNLMPIDSVESFIRQYKHLPDIPSEQEVSSDGIDVGDMNKLLLQKVEELTLYIIDLRKELKELKEKR